MTQPDFHTTATGRKLAYHQTDGTGPGLVFLGGFKSDMEGTKALYLEQKCRENGRAFLRFDYSGHGQSSEDFTDGCIGDWAEDAMDIIAALTQGPQIIVGSSMGGWISLIMAKTMPEKFAGLVTIAAAPDFTADGMWNSFDDAQKKALETDGQIALPSEYGDPYIITKKLIDDGNDQLVLRAPLNLPFPTRFLQGTADAEVDVSVAYRLLDHATGPNMRLVVLKDADHRFSDPEPLQLLDDAIENVFQQL